MEANQIEELKKLILQYQGVKNDFERQRVSTNLHKQINSHFQIVFSSYKSNYCYEYEDIMAIAKEKFFKILPKIEVDNTEKMISFINKCAKNAVNNHLKKVKKEQKIKEKLTENVHTEINNIPESNLIVQSSYENFIQHLINNGFTKLEITVVKEYFTPTFEKRHTLLEVSKICSLSEQRAQRIIQKANKIKEELFSKEMPKEKKIKPRKNRKTTRPKQGKSQTKLSLLDISNAFHKFDPDVYYVCTKTQNGDIFYYLRIKTSIEVSFNENGTMNFTPSIPSKIYQGEKIFYDIENQLKSFEILTKEDLRSEKNSVKTAGFFYKFNIQGLIKYYAPKKTKEEMVKFLKEIGRYNKCRKYITRYKDYFLPPK